MSMTEEQLKPGIYDEHINLLYGEDTEIFKNPSAYKSVSDYKSFYFYLASPKFVLSRYAFDRTFFSLVDLTNSLSPFSPYFTECQKLRRVWLPKKLEYFAMNETFTDTNNLSEIIIDDTNRNFCTVDGIFI